MSRSLPTSPCVCIFLFVPVLGFVSAGACRTTTLSRTSPRAHWRLIGPHRGGRVTASPALPATTKTYYMGTPGGGVWKTTNAGTTWFPIFDQAARLLRSAT